MNSKIENPPVQAEAESGPASHARFGVLAWLCLAATVAYICRNSIAVAESTMRADLGLTEQQMGLVMSAFFATYAFGQIPSGWLADRLGSRRALPLFSVAWSAATAAMAGATGMVWLVASRLLNGAAQAGLFPGSTNTISKWFPGTQRAIASGALSSFMSAGGAVGAALTGWLVVQVGWRSTFVLYSGLGVVWALGFYSWFRNLPEQHRRVNRAELDRIVATRGDTSGEGAREATPWLAMASSPAMWWICSQQFFRAAGYMFFASWFATYMQETRGVSVAESGLLTMLPLLAVVVGGLCGGAVSDWVLVKTGSRRWARQGVASSSLLLCSALILAAYFIEDPWWAVGVISMGTLCFAVGGPCAYTITIDMGGQHVATVFSTMNMTGNIGAMLFPYVVPWFRQATSWESVLLLFGGLYLTAALCWLLLNPEGTIFDQSLLGRRPLKEKTP